MKNIMSLKMWEKWGYKFISPYLVIFANYKYINFGTAFIANEYT